MTQPPLLDLDGVGKDYCGPGEVVHAVDGVSLALEAGDLVAIYGPSGSGKTTLLLLAAGLLHPDGGTVRFRGRDIGALTESEAAEYRLRELGFIFQTFNLVPGMTALENVALPIMLGGARYAHACRHARPLVERVGLADRADHRPGQLSGGERQRVAIARALAAKPKLILADEPTGNLDTRRGDEVLALLSDLARDRGVAVILVTHDIHAATFADRILVMRDGKLADEPPPTEGVVIELKRRGK